MVKRAHDMYIRPIRIFLWEQLKVNNSRAVELRTDLRLTKAIFLLCLQTQAEQE